MRAHWESNASTIITDPAIRRAYTDLQVGIHTELQSLADTYVRFIANLQAGGEEAQRFAWAFGQVLWLLGQLRSRVADAVAALQPRPPWWRALARRIAKPAPAIEAQPGQSSD